MRSAAWPSPYSGGRSAGAAKVATAARSATGSSPTSTFQPASIVSRMNGQIEKTDNWGRRKLAYEIGKFKEGVYVLEVINGSGELMKELDRRLKVIDGHLRLKAARKLNMTHDPVLLCDEWRPAQVKAFPLDGEPVCELGRLG